jgi:hypothetical protein
MNETFGLRVPENLQGVVRGFAWEWGVSIRGVD